MADPAALQEAIRRGLVPPQQTSPAMQEAIRRGLVPGQSKGFWRNLLSGIAQGAADMSNPAYGQERAGEIASMAPTVPELPSAEQATGGFQQMGAIVEPTNLGERYLQSATRGAVAGLPGGPAGAVGGAISGTGSQTAREFDAPRWVEIAAGIGAPLLAGGVMAAWRATAPSHQAQLGQALRGVTEQEMRAAENLMRQAQQAGSPVTWSEALNQVSNGRFGQMAQLQRVAEQSPGGAQVMSPIMSQRLEQSRRLSQENLNRLGPQPQGQALQDVPANLQQTAKGTINEAVRDMRSITRPIYEAARTQTTPQQKLAAIVAKLDDEIARTGSDQVRQQMIAFRRDLVDTPAQAGTPGQTITTPGTRPGTRINQFTPAQPGTPEQLVLDVGRLDSIRKAWRDRIELPDPNVNAAAVPKEAAAKIGPILSDIRNLMSQSSRAYESGRVFHQRAMNDAIEPLQRGPIGQLSQGQPNLAGQRANLLPVGQQGVIDPQTITATVRRLEQTSPGAARDWLRTNLQSEWDEVLKALKTAGADESRGASLWAHLSGNQTRRANLQAYVDALDPSGQTWQGFERMLQVLGAQRYRLPANSSTAFNQETIAALKGKGIPVSLEDLNPLTALQGEVKQASALRRYRINSERLAQLLIDPDAAVRLRALARLNPGNPGARSIVGGLLATMAEE